MAFAVVPRLGSWAPGADPDEQAQVCEEQLNPISFESAPSLYFVSFDGLGPQSLGQEYLDIETTDLVDFVNTEFRRLPNMFSESRWSLHSLNILAALDHEIYQSALLRAGITGHLTGQYPSALFCILDANGYETNFVYPYSNFGSIKGPYIDNVVIGQARHLCTRLDPSISALAFWGYCNLPLDDTARWYRGIFEDQLEKVLPIAGKQGPQFLMTYFRLPEHTPPGFDNSDPAQRERFAEQYVSNSRKAAWLLARLVEKLDREDPDAILFVFGDHGPRLTYNMEFEDDPDLFVKDSYAVLGGIYPPDACETSFDQILSEPYLTTLDAVHAILRCLSGGEEALVHPREAPGDRTIIGYHDIPDDGVERSFADYLYE